ncbi:hypothetical protein [Spirochaeta cellobiosiphila]|uniref:hypothetical protein n=1 Tax=Spirochaeta cellobiosiphila TaxID=504483 RepID=UPI0004284C00|nr:hypothetical protein [Spirochaeta cellobiosiphila]
MRKLFLPLFILMTVNSFSLDINNPEDSVFSFFLTDDINLNSLDHDSSWHWIYGGETRHLINAKKYLIGYFGESTTKEQEVYILDLEQYEKDKMIVLDLWSEEVTPSYILWDKLPTVSYPPIILDGDSRDWLTIPALSIFSEDFIPTVYTRESDNNIATFDINDAEDYREQLPNSIKAKTFQNSLFMLVNRDSDAVREGPYYLYLYHDRSESAKYVIEIPNQVKQGPIYLWNVKEKIHDIIGYYYDGIENLEIEINISQLDSIVNKEGLSLDLTYSRSMDSYREEFFIITLYWEDFEYLK